MHAHRHANRPACAPNSPNRRGRVYAISPQRAITIHEGSRAYEGLGKNISRSRCDSDAISCTRTRRSPAGPFTGWLIDESNKSYDYKACERRVSQRGVGRMGGWELVGGSCRPPDLEELPVETRCFESPEWVWEDVLKCKEGKLREFQIFTDCVGGTVSWKYEEERREREEQRDWKGWERGYIYIAWHHHEVHRY